MDNDTLLFRDKGAGVFKEICIYPNRITTLKKNRFFGKHIEVTYLNDVTGVYRIKGKQVILNNRLRTGYGYRLSSRSQAEESARVLNAIMER